MFRDGIYAQMDELGREMSELRRRNPDIVLTMQERRMRDHFRSLIESWSQITVSSALMATAIGTGYHAPAAVDTRYWVEV